VSAEAEATGAGVVVNVVGVVDMESRAGG
jgi:hypothetical protein